MRQEFISLKVVGDKRAHQALERKRTKWVPAQLKFAKTTAMRVRAALQRAYSEGPLHARENLLEQSVEEIVRRDGARFVCGAGTEEIYAPVHEHGAVIFGRPWLRFMVDGRWISCRKVTIPARRPAETAHRDVEDEVRGIWLNGVRGFVNG